MAKMGQVTTLTSGPWKGVRTTVDPFDDPPDLLTDAVNCFLPDPTNGCGLYSRPGFKLSKQAIGGGTVVAQGGIHQTGSDGTERNFFVISGKLYRTDTAMATFTDATPTTIAISAAVATRVYLLPFADSLVVTDGVNTPWVGTNLGATPITATPIPLTGTGVTLSRGTTDTAVASTAFPYQIAGVVYSKVAVPVGTALPAGTIPINTWGVFRATINAAGTITITAGAANFTTGYASEAAAIAAVPAWTPASAWNMGYLTVQTGAGVTFRDGTDALAGGASGNPATTTHYFAGDGDPWTAFAAPTEYGGSAFFITNTVPTGSAVIPRLGIVWCEPNQPLVGYTQTGYTDFWNLIQTSSRPLYAIWGTNNGLYYWRDTSTSLLTGTPNSSFSGSATVANVSGTIGSICPGTVQQYRDTVYFCDQLGRPQRLPIGGTVQEPQMWLQMRQAVDVYAQYVTNTTTLTTSAIAALDPITNSYVCGSWSTDAANAAPWPVVDLFVFDAATGIYCGTWEINGGRGPTGAFPSTSARTVGVLVPQRVANGLPVLAALIYQSTHTSDLDCTVMSTLGVQLYDNNGGGTEEVMLATGRLGYQSNMLWNAGQYCSALLAVRQTPPTSVYVYATTTAAASTQLGVVTPTTANDGSARIMVGTDLLAARGITITLYGNAGGGQFIAQQIQLPVVASLAGPEDV